MVFIQRIKAAAAKLRRNKTKQNSELAAEEVIEQEVFPDKRTPAKTKKCAASSKKTTSARKKPSERTRPTNNNYTMIDPDNESADSGKS